MGCALESSVSEHDLAASPILGHQWVVELAGRRLASGQQPHAYLLAGPASVGKFTTALAVVRLLLCGDGTGCGTCRGCQLVARRAHPDLRVLELPPDRKNIPLREVHEFTEGIALRPLEAARKVYVLRGAQDLAEEGANALLKILEEPPPAVTFLLTTTAAGLLPPTIVSRCQVLALRPVAADEIAARLVSAYGVEPERAELLARTSQGRPGRAIAAALDPQAYEDRLRRGRDLFSLLAADRLHRLRYADDLAEQWGTRSEEVLEVLDGWAELWRDVLLVQQGLETRVVTLPLLDQIEAAAAGLAPRVVGGAVADTLDTARALRGNAHPRLALEAYLLLSPRLAPAEASASSDGAPQGGAVAAGPAE